jgi:hypothetical protein
MSPILSIIISWRVESTAEKLLKLAFALQLLNLALQHVYPVVLESLLDPRSSLRVLCHGARCRRGARQKTNFTTKEKAANREQEVRGSITPSGRS